MLIQDEVLVNPFVNTEDNVQNNTQKRKIIDTPQPKKKPKKNKSVSEQLSTCYFHFALLHLNFLFR